MKRANFEFIIKEADEARHDLFRYNIDNGIQKVILLIQKLTPLARERNKERELNLITTALMSAIKESDYLLFADIACYELPILFDVSNECAKEVSSEFVK